MRVRSMSPWLCGSLLAVCLSPWPAMAQMPAPTSALLYEGLGSERVSGNDGTQLIGFFNISGIGGRSGHGIANGAWRSHYGDNGQARGMVITRTGTYLLEPAGFGTPYSNVRGITEAGLAMGNTGGRAAFWLPGSGSMPTALPVPTGWSTPPPYTNVTAAMVGSSTGMVGGVGHDGSAQRVLRWNANLQTVEVLESLSGTSAPGHELFAVNDDGGMVGRASLTGLGTVPLRWDAGSATVTRLDMLGQSPNGLFRGEALDINGAGTAVGFVYKRNEALGSGGAVPVRWEAGGSAVTELQTFPPGTQPNQPGGGNARAINSVGTVAGVLSKHDVGDHGARAVVWDAGGVELRELDVLTRIDGYAYTIANDINDSGWVVGRATAEATILGFNPNADHAVLWSPEGEVIDLNSFLPADSRWILAEAFTISNDGWVTGRGYYLSAPGVFDDLLPRAFAMQLLPVPEPSSAALLALGVMALSWRLRRQRG